LGKHRGSIRKDFSQLAATHIVGLSKVYIPYSEHVKNFRVSNPQPAWISPSQLLLPASSGAGFFSPSKAFLSPRPSMHWSIICLNICECREARIVTSSRTGTALFPLTRWWPAP